eukprot:2264278-Prymnesium_polylepis.1
MLRACTALDVSAACRQFRCRDCRDCTARLFTPAPIIEARWVKRSASRAATASSACARAEPRAPSPAALSLSHPRTLARFRGVATRGLTRR